jgi:hypothetical protein
MLGTQVHVGVGVLVAVGVGVGVGELVAVLVGVTEFVHKGLTIKIIAFP